MSTSRSSLPPSLYASPHFEVLCRPNTVRQVLSTLHQADRLIAGRELDGSRIALDEARGLWLEMISRKDLFRAMTSLTYVPLSEPLCPVLDAFPTLRTARRSAKDDTEAAVDAQRIEEDIIQSENSKDPTLREPELTVLPDKHEFPKYTHNTSQRRSNNVHPLLYLCPCNFDVKSGAHIPGSRPCPCPCICPQTRSLLSAVSNLVSSLSTIENSSHQTKSKSEKQSDSIIEEAISLTPGARSAGLTTCMFRRRQTAATTSSIDGSYVALPKQVSGQWFADRRRICVRAQLHDLFLHTDGTAWTGSAYGWTGQIGGAARAHLDSAQTLISLWDGIEFTATPVETSPISPEPSIAQDSATSIPMDSTPTSLQYDIQVKGVSLSGVGLSGKLVDNPLLIHPHDKFPLATFLAHIIPSHNLQSIDLSFNHLHGSITQSLEGLVGRFFDSTATITDGQPLSLESLSQLNASLAEVTPNLTDGTVCIHRSPQGINNIDHNPMIISTVPRIPPTLLNELREINIAGNSLRGSLSPSLVSNTDISSQLSMFHSTMEANQSIESNGLPFADSIFAQANKWTGFGFTASGVVAPTFHSALTASGVLSKLTSLNFAYNEFSGHLPDCFSELVALEYLNLSGNNFRGPLPPSIGECLNLRELRLQQNKFSGPVPASFANLVHLLYLNLSHNRLTHGLLYFAQLPKLTHIQLNHNRLQEPIAPFLQYPMESLKYLNLQRNSMYGPLQFSPDDVTFQMPSLRYLNLSSNRLRGPLPANLASLPMLQFLYLHDNEFCGPFPSNWNNLSTSLRDITSFRPIDAELISWPARKLEKQKFNAVFRRGRELGLDSATWREETTMHDVALRETRAVLASGATPSEVMDVWVAVRRLESSTNDCEKSLHSDTSITMPPMEEVKQQQSHVLLGGRSSVWG